MNKFKISILFLTTCINGAWAQIPIQAHVSGNIFNTSEKEVKLSQFMGNQQYRDFASANLDEKGNFVLDTQLPSKDYYVLRVGNQFVNLVFQKSDSIAVYADASNLLNFTNIVGSEPSAAILGFFREYQNFTTQRDSAQIIVQQHPERQKEIEASFKTTYLTFNAFRSRFISTNKNSPALIATLQSIDPQKEFDIYSNVMTQVIESMDGSPTANSLIQAFQQQRQKHEDELFLGQGKQAPEIAMMGIDDKIHKLSDLKGKYVLIDFWASWCGPCRHENPNVVKMYEKYKDKGFTVFSVSLDKDKASWQKAVQQDNLSWPDHVSDLAYWSNAAAQLYKVKSVPFSVLIDKDGKIIQTNLRGFELEQALATIFGF